MEYKSMMVPFGCETMSSTSLELLCMMSAASLKDTPSRLSWFREISRPPDRNTELSFIHVHTETSEVMPGHYLTIVRIHLVWCVHLGQLGLQVLWMRWRSRGPVSQHGLLRQLQYLEPKYIKSELIFCITFSYIRSRIHLPRPTLGSFLRETQIISLSGDRTLVGVSMRKGHCIVLFPN